VPCKWVHPKHNEIPQTERATQVRSLSLGEVKRARGDRFQSSYPTLALPILSQQQARDRIGQEDASLPLARKLASRMSAMSICRAAAERRAAIAVAAAFRRPEHDRVIGRDCVLESSTPPRSYFLINPSLV